jgi:hypothetical protein
MLYEAWLKMLTVNALDRAQLLDAKQAHAVQSVTQGAGWVSTKQSTQ